MYVMGVHAYIVILYKNVYDTVVDSILYSYNSD